MLLKVNASCRPECGVLVRGEVETTSREFIHRFTFPAGMGVPGPPRTEVEETLLATFGPDSKHWFVPCPGCGAMIRLDSAVSWGT
jgi:hypothetical protein